MKLLTFNQGRVHMKASYSYILLFLFTSQAHAGFMFCESKLKKIGLTKEEAKTACNSSYIDSTKEMLNTEDPKEMAKVIRLISSSSSYNWNFYDLKKSTVDYGITDPKFALKIVKILPDEALKDFYSLIKKFGKTDALKMATILPPEKIVYANKIAVKYSGNTASFYNLMNTATTDQLATYTLLLEKLSSEKAALLISNYTKKNIECGLSFTKSSSYEDNISLCKEYHSGKLCGSKAMLFATALKDPTSNMSTRLVDEHLKSSDHYTKNHALIYDKIYSAGFYSEISSTTEKLLKNVKISDELTNKVLKEFENPFITSSMIKGLLNSELSSTTLTGRTFEESGKVAANWGNGSLSACSSDNGRAAISRVSDKLQSQCQKTYEGKTGLICDIDVDSNRSEGICRFSVTVKSTFDKDKSGIKSCYDQDLEDGISALSKINKIDKSNSDTSVNETRLQKENQAKPSTDSEKKSTNTSDR